MLFSSPKAMVILACVGCSFQASIMNPIQESNAVSPFPLEKRALLNLTGILAALQTLVPAFTAAQTTIVTGNASLAVSIGALTTLQAAILPVIAQLAFTCLPLCALTATAAQIAQFQSIVTSVLNSLSAIVIYLTVTLPGAVTTQVQTLLNQIYTAILRALGIAPVLGVNLTSLVSRLNLAPSLLSGLSAAGGASIGIRAN